MSLILESENRRSLSLFDSELLKLQKSTFSGPEHFFLQHFYRLPSRSTKEKTMSHRFSRRNK